MDLIFFIVLVGVLIFVHELGHFMWAKFFGVKVLRFSLGFGPRIAGFRRGDTEYVLAVVPLGGYVQMLGENPSDVILPRDRESAFFTQPLWKRGIIVVAGPAMNMLLPILLYFIVFLGDGLLPAAVVGTVVPGQPAYGALLPGDRITAIDGEEVGSFYDVNRIVSESAGEKLSFEFERDAAVMTRTIIPTLVTVPREPMELRLVDVVGRIGISSYRPLPVVGISRADGPAASAGMRTFDLIVSAAGRPIEVWLDLKRALTSNRGAMLPVTYLRPVRLEGALDGLIEMDIYEPHVAQLTPDPGSGSGLERAGIELADLHVSHVTVNSPEHRMGVLPGDKLIALDGRPVRDFATFIKDLEVGRGREHELTWDHGGQQRTDRFHLRRERGVNEYGHRYDRFTVGINHWMPARPAPLIQNPNPTGYAIERSVGSIWELTEVTVISVVRLLQGELSVKSLGGPISVFQVAGTAARKGTRDYLRLMGFISINLGLINLLPIPLLDGGHLLFFLFEAVARRRASMKIRQYASLVGLSVLLVIMVLAFKNDIERQWPQLVEMVGGE